MVFNNNLLLGAAGQGGGTTPFDPTLIGNSVWLEGASDYFSKTYAGSGNSTTEAIFAFWYQRYNFGVAQTTWFEASGFGGLQTNTSYGGGDTLVVNSFDAGGTQVIARHTRLLRDTSWYHIIVSIDMSQATTLDKIKFYINGEQDTTINVQNLATTNGLDMLGARSKVNFRIGENTGSAGHAYAQFCYLDGVSIQQGDYAVTDFLDTFTFGTNGSQYVPKTDADIAALATTVGGNSFCLDFADSADLGNDISSNANDFTVNSMSSVNQSANTPSHVSTIFNAINAGSTSYAILSEGNRKASFVSSGGSSFTTTLSFDGSDSSGFYIEIETPTTNGIDYPGVGVWSTLYLNNNPFSAKNTGAANSTILGYNDGSWRLNSNGTTRYHNNVSSTVTGTALSSGGRFAICVKNNKLYIGTISGTTLTWSNSGDPDAETGELYTLDASDNKYQIGGIVYSTGNLLLRTNSDEWVASSIPSDVKSITSDNLAAPDYQGIDYFNATLYTGNGTAIGSGGKAVTGVGFQPDFTWIKNRDAADSHILTDVVRGVTKYISSDSTAAEVTNAESLSTFDTDGFTVGNLAAVNTNTEDYVSWNWLAGGTGSSNTDGSITSTVTVADAGHFSVISFTGNATSGATIGHGMSAAPEMIWIKERDNANGWIVGSDVVGYTKILRLDTTDAATTDSGAFNNTAPSATLITLGSNNGTNRSSGQMICYAFRSVSGVCKVGSYIGNSSTDGPYISLGFKPRWWLVKETTVSDSAHDWFVSDSARYTYNGTTTAGGLNGGTLEANDTTAEESHSTNFGNNPAFDFLSDGIKLRTNSGVINATGRTYIYIAMADIGGDGTLPPIYGR
jgi:hypothetical protein